ncbi:leucine-rich repeat domain-containing protein [Flavobacterium sp. 5]|uniref:leucine-rich repeat domain-containing protein n=1 Tax=Flavobacterium sp. 5 TaxID=2035199 RepID=UPI000C2CA887|nr:leucine-rich repeat domain-containing protein [Flavobacterium sp. 5]PKB17156.1 leucine rich repeat (LRR) protein [Flavobacterium sp. 5]
MINFYILIPVLLMGFFLFAQPRNSSKYKYLFRNTILSKSKKHELASVLRGRVYYPRYFYIPSLKQYMVYSDLDETGPFRMSQMKSKPEGKAYSLLDENGNNVITFETPLRFSSRSGSFYGASSYIPFLETGKKETHSYDQIYNSTLDLSRREFEKLFIQLYTSSEYVEFINLRTSGDDIHEAGVVFKRQDKVEVLLAGLRDSRMIRYFQEDKKINNFDDYYLPDIKDKETFPQSKPSIEMIWLETKDTNPFVHWRTGLNHEFRIKKYIGTYASGWRGIMKVGGIPIYAPSETSGTVYVRFKTKGETFRVKILDVEKFGPAYNLGLRTFQLPASIRTKNSLVFMESVQNCGDNRLGGGVFVVRPTANTNSSADIPSDMTEEHFNTLPVTLQEALLDPNAVTSLKVYDENRREWIPELERLKNLTHLEITTAISEIPDAISKFPKLQELRMEHCNIDKISPQLAQLTELRELNLFSNKLTEFPLAFLELKNLKRLNIGANRISNLPSNINVLNQLEYLSLTLTEVTTLPESMIGMKKLYIDDSNDLEHKVPKEYKHLFVYTKEKLEAHDLYYHQQKQKLQLNY